MLQKIFKPVKKDKEALLSSFIYLVKSPDVFHAGYIVKSVEIVWGLEN